MSHVHLSELQLTWPRQWLVVDILPTLVEKIGREPQDQRGGALQRRVGQDLPAHRPRHAPPRLLLQDAPRLPGEQVSSDVQSPVSLENRNQILPVRRLQNFVVSSIETITCLLFCKAYRKFKEVNTKLVVSDLLLSSVGLDREGMAELWSQICPEGWPRGRQA